MHSLSLHDDITVWERMGLHNLYDVAHTNRSKDKANFGVIGDALYFHAWGIDYSNLAYCCTPDDENRGYNNSQILFRDYTTVEDIETILFETADQVATRLRNHNVVCTLVSISIGFSEADGAGHRGWSTQTKIDPSNRTDDIIQATRYLFENRWEGEPVRSIGVHVGNVFPDHEYQTSLFENTDSHENNKKLEHTIDQIRSRYGYKSIIRGYSKKAAGTAVYRNTNLIGGHQA